MTSTTVRMPTNQMTSRRYGGDEYVETRRRRNGNESYDIEHNPKPYNSADSQSDSFFNPRELS